LADNNSAAVVVASSSTSEAGGVRVEQRLLGLEKQLQEVLQELYSQRQASEAEGIGSFSAHVKQQEAKLRDAGAIESRPSHARGCSITATSASTSANEEAAAARSVSSKEKMGASLSSIANVSNSARMGDDDALSMGPRTWGPTSVATGSMSYIDELHGDMRKSSSSSGLSNNRQRGEGESSSNNHNTKRKAFLARWSEVSAYYASLTQHQQPKSSSPPGPAAGSSLAAAEVHDGASDRSKPTVGDHRSAPLEGIGDGMGSDGRRQVPSKHQRVFSSSPERRARIYAGYTSPLALLEHEQKWIQEKKVE
jgi:hypothetical protein